MNKNLTIRLANTEDAAWLGEIMEKDWGGLPLIIRNKKYFPNLNNAIIAENSHSRIGFLLYEIQDKNCEIVVFEAFDKFKGIGTLLLERLKKLAKTKNCTRIYLMTHNDNLDALRFYQRRGFHICGIHLDSMKIARTMKPSITTVGDYGIPVRDEIDLELFL